ncbi:arylsulfatase [Cryomorphaceae bacterium]|nr:arylsulfatase [Cryomorphaceae bacterium]
MKRIEMILNKGLYACCNWVKGNLFRACFYMLSALIISIGFSACQSNNEEPNELRPNILLIVVDDAGFSDFSSYGGEISTPNIDQLASNGVQFTRFYTQPMCAPTRASILSGVDNHQNGLGAMPPMHTQNQYMQPGYEGYLNEKVVTLPEVLRDNGYQTYMSGKWHLGCLDSTQYPNGRGFERSFAQMAGSAGHFQDGFATGPIDVPVTFYVEDNRRIEELSENFYTTKDYTDYMIQYIKESDEEKPIFGYLAYTAPHDPLHVTDEYIDKYKGAYDEGFDAIRRARLERMKNMGLVDESVPYNPGTGNFTQWDSLTADEKVIQARRMEVYAAMIACVDDQIGRLVETLEAEKRLENTVFIVMSDNGPNPYDPEFYYLGSVDEFNKQGFDNSLENMGRDNSFISLGGAWAEVTATPFSYYKTTTGEGGIRTPLIISGVGIEANGVKDITVHAADIYPTVLELADAKRPETYRGNPMNPLFGRSAKPLLEGEEDHVRDTEIEPLCFEISGYKTVIQGDWKLMQGKAFKNGGKWVLINLEEDPTEKTDLSEEYPDKVKEMAEHWEEYSVKHGYIPPEGNMYVIEIGAETFYNYGRDYRVK